MPIYLQIDGIQGDSTHETHRRWTDIESLNWNVTRTMNTYAGSASNREASEPTVGEVILTKVSDSSTTKLFQEACSGRNGKTATIDLVSTGNPGDTYVQFTLHNTLISGYTISTTGDRPIETVTLNFTKMDVKYTPYDDQNQQQSPMIASYDLATARAS